VDPLREFEEICKEYAEFRESILEGLAMSDGTREGDMLFELAVALDTNMDEFRREVPLAIADYQKSAEVMQAEAERIQRDLAAMEAKLEEKQAAQQAAEQPPASPPLDFAAFDWDLPTLTDTLTRYRGELLDLLKDGKSAADVSGRDFREIWQDWTNFGEK